MRFPVFVLCALLLGLLAPAFSQVTLPTPAELGWEKITGVPDYYSGVTDGIMDDRQNSYAWSMEIHNGYLYVGTMRNVIGLVLLMNGTSPYDFPPEIPFPTDLRGRIYRMSLATGVWEQFYLSPATNATPPINGLDMGYRYMKEYTAPGASPVLYVGGVSFGSNARLLAIDAENNPPVPVFISPGFNLRAITPHNGELYWASDNNDFPVIWHAPNPLKAYQDDPAVTFPSIDVPSDWFPNGAEILDMVSYNKALYVFFFDHDYTNGGFWCAKLTSTKKGGWVWQLLVGDQALGAIYPKGMGRMENGGATPFVFKNQVYVGTLSNTMWRFLLTGQIDTENIPPTGTQVFRFGKSDKWERLIPPAWATQYGVEDALNGFAHPLNLYLWRYAENNGKLYAGTFDAYTALELFAPQWNLDLSQLNLWDPAGFDLYTTTDGQTWFPETLDGFADRWNYGARTLKTDPATGDLYLGTANPFYGCQVWRKNAQ